jgi:signal recognition particle subunit SRP54
VGLVQDFEKHIDQETAEQNAKKMLRGDFSYDDFVKQLKMIRRMGPLKDIIGKIPGLSGIMDQIPAEAFDDRELDRTMAMIQSMTKQERNFPDVLDDSRFRRISAGCGQGVEDVSDLHTRFLGAREMMGGLGNMMKNPAQMQQMQQKMAGGGFPGMDAMGGLGGMFGAAPQPKQPALSAAEKIARRKKQKTARKSRKKNRR